MRIWRITKRRYAASCLDGIGAKLAGGRWNPPGLAVAYCSGSLSLATLEYFVHVDPDEVPASMCSIPVEVPAGVALETAKAPADWNAHPPPASTQAYGEAWLRAKRSLILVVPSVVTPSESNYLVNPAHPDLARLRVMPPLPFSFDPRLFK